MNTYIVENHSRQFWIDRQGWATSDETKATRYSREDANELAHQMHGFAVDLSA